MIIEIVEFDTKHSKGSTETVIVTIRNLRVDIIRKKQIWSRLPRNHATLKSMYRRKSSDEKPRADILHWNRLRWRPLSTKNE